MSSDSTPRQSAGRRPARTVWRWSQWAPAGEATSREGRIDGGSHGRTDERRAQADPERAALLPRRLRPRGSRRVAEDQGAAREAAVSRALFRVERLLVRIVLWNLADSKTTIEELRRYLRDESVEQFAEVPGLRFKAWISDEATERWGAVYLWESAEAAVLGTRAYFPTLGRAWTTRHPRVSVTSR